MLVLAERCHSFPAMSGPVLHRGRSESRPKVGISELSCIRVTHPFCYHLRYSIIKRRVAWFVGKWTTEESAPVNNGRIWEILAHLLQDQRSSTEMAVRLTAASALRMCINVRIVVVGRCEQEDADSR